MVESDASPAATHVGHIGMLGLKKAGVESYQLTLGGTGDETCSIGDITSVKIRA